MAGVNLLERAVDPMWIIVLGFVVTTLLLVWLLFGYVVWLRFVGDGRRRAGVAPLTTFPTISVVVPCLNEKGMIVEKYDDLVRCDYPREKVEIVFADGEPHVTHLAKWIDAHCNRHWACVEQLAVFRCEVGPRTEVQLARDTVREPEPLPRISLVPS